MSLTSSDSLQPTSALYQEETERITGQKYRDWERVKAILLQWTTQALSGTHGCSLSL